MARASSVGGDNVQLFQLLGDIKALVESRTGELRTLHAGLSANQEGLQKQLTAIHESHREFRGELADIKADKAKQKDLDKLSRDILEKLSNMESEKADRASFDAQSDLLENLGARMDDIVGKLDQIARIEATVQANQLRLDQVQTDVKPLLDSHKQQQGRSQGRTETLKWIWIVVVTIVGWLLTCIGLWIALTRRP